MTRLRRGDRLPSISTPPPGPRARELCRELARYEAPGVNTLAFGDAILWEEALGANVLDVDGNLYVDLTAGFGVAVVGHRRPEVVARAGEQAGRLVHGLGDVHAHPARVALAARLAELAPVDEPRVYWAASGSDAVEIALKTALLATGRPRVVAFEPAYHGLTLGALAATSREAFREPFVGSLRPLVARLPFGCDPKAVAAALDADGGAGCLVVEPIVGREGVLVPPPGWLGEVAALCRERQVSLVADEIFTGFGRTGRMFAVEHEGVRPDLVCCGKALGGGYPIAAVVGRAPLMAAWSSEGEARHTSTFLAHPVACAAALATLDLLADDSLARAAQMLGTHLRRRLRAWPERFPAIRELRGRGLLWGLEMADADSAKALVAGALGRGVLILAGGPEGRVAQLAPPLTISAGQLDAALEALEECLAGAG